jgi:carboxymethylenebutenolidase
MAEKIAAMFRECREGRISRREFIHKTIAWTGSLAAAATLFDLLGPHASHANLVDPSDSTLISTDIKFSSTDGAAIGAYLTRPKGDGKFPAVVVIHENRGLNDHIRDVARRLARAGYVAIAPDLLSRQGGTASFKTDSAATEGIRNLDEETSTRDFNSAVSYLKGQTFVQANKIGLTGFCWGGGNVLLFATRNKDIATSVVFYGRNPRNIDDIQNIVGPVMGLYGGEDKGITGAVPNLEAAMKKYGKSFEYKIYPGAPHGFHNETNLERYRTEAAQDAWSKTLEYFKKHLQG